MHQNIHCMYATIGKLKYFLFIGLGESEGENKINK